ncbi:hypothetical protein BH10PSE7_BH10PSE7_03560 [soil metagenome]
MSKMFGAAFCIAILAGATGAAAAERPTIPASAMKLDGVSIQAIYDGKRMEFENYSYPKPLTGQVWYDFAKKKAMWGTYVFDGKENGLFRGKIRVKGDLFCYKEGKEKEICVSVHLDGSNLYEADAKNVVISVDTIVAAAPPALPESAKKATPGEAMTAIGGKPVTVVIYDLPEPTIADLKWDAAKKRVTGKFIYGATKDGKVDGKISVAGEQVCVTNKGEKKANCHDIYLDAGGFYEVTADGKMHAMSTYQ